MTIGAAPGSLEQLRALPLGPETRALELPAVRAVGPGRARRPTRKAMLGGRFYVYGTAESLRPPIEWHQDPHGSRTWRYELHTLTWLKEALARHARGGDAEMLAVARDVALDWARAHLRAQGEQSEFAWYDMAVGLRAPYLGYVLRACLAEGTLAGEDAALLLDAAERHGEFLADGRNFAGDHNHGLFQDEGLYLLARQLPVLPAATAWRELARVRLRTTLRETVSFADGAHLEHSPAYQLAIVDLLDRLSANARELPELAELLDRMRRTAAWHVAPSGRLAQLGDTDDLPAPRWARDTAAQLRGLCPLFEAGQAFVREGGSYLAVSAAHHGAAHKHADDAGVMLVEGGRTLLGDAGRWGYYEREPDRLYARSAAAHNVLAVDGEDFGWRAAEPYGSGLQAAGEGGGWYAILVCNPLLARQGVEHRRALLYRPGRALIVLDEVRSAAEHAYTRRFHLGAGLEAERAGDGRIAIAGGEADGADAIEAVLVDGPGDAELTLLRGQEEPRRGWAYPGDRERREVWTVELEARATEATFGVALALDGAALEVAGATFGPAAVEVELRGAPSLTVPVEGRLASVRA